jgi:hypothetical protein
MHAAGAAVAQHIAQRLIGDAQQGIGLRSGQGGRGVDVELQCNAAGLRPGQRTFAQTFAERRIRFAAQLVQNLRQFLLHLRA